MSDQNTSPYALEEIAQFLNSEAAQYLLDPESMDRGSLPFKREIRIVLDNLRNDPSKISAQELLQLRYVTEGGREVVQRDIRPIVSSVQDGTYRPPVSQSVFERPQGGVSQNVNTERETPKVEMSGDLYQRLRRYLEPQFVLYLDGANPSTLTPSDRATLDALVSDFTSVELDERTVNRLFRDSSSNETQRFVEYIRANQVAAITGEPLPERQQAYAAQGADIDLSRPSPQTTSAVPEYQRPNLLPAGDPSQFPQYEGPTTIQESQVEVPYTDFEVLRKVAGFLQPEYRDFVLLGRHEAPAVTNIDAQDVYLTTGARQLTASEQQFLDRVRANPLNINIQDYRDYVIAGVWTNDEQTGVGQRLSNVIAAEKKFIADYKQSETERPTMRLPEGQEWFWNNKEKKWGIRRSDLSKRIIASTVSDIEVRTRRFANRTSESLERAAGLEPGEFFERGIAAPKPVERPTPERAGVQTRPASVGSPAAPIPPSDRGMAATPPSDAPAVPPTDRQTLGLPLTPEQRYGTGEGTQGPPDRMGGPATIEPRQTITLGEPAGDFDPTKQLAVPAGTLGQVDAVYGDAISPFVAAPGTTTGTVTDTGDGDNVGAVVVPDAPAVPEEWEQAASEIYGAYYSIIKQNPEVAALIAQASAEKWGPEKFDYALEQTEWWRTTSQAIRTFDIEMERDPATVQARIDALASTIQQDALNLNIRLTSETLNRLATDSIRQGWTEQQLVNALGTEAIKAGTTGISSLRYGYYGNKVNEIAASYGVSISETEFSELVNKFAVGQENEESLTSAFQTRATALFPGISERLSAGESFRNIVEPYRARASQILGRDFSATDFMDNDSFAQAVTYMGDDGKQRPMTYTEWGQYLRNTREFGYEYTDEAQSRAYQVANRIADIFGAV